MLARFEQFIRERQFLANASPATIEWYTQSLKWLRSESPSDNELKDAVMRMREKGRKATGCNAAIRAINAYLHWCKAGTEKKCGPGCTHLRVPYLKEPQLVMPTFTAAQVKLLVRWKPRPTNFCQKRLHLLTLLLLDTGCRISEALTLRINDLDMENLLVTLDGKGRKQRIVPFSFELRKTLFRYISDYRRTPDRLLLASRNETMLGRRVMLRDVKRLCKRLGFAPPARTLHAFRHTFAVNYLRRDGSVFHLQKVLGHSSLEMTRRYANLVTADLQAVHERVSLLRTSAPESNKMVTAELPRGCWRGV
ncbi:MAG TPA: tyrosine-type recombinase/integrase [Terriglobales bacterium]|nr:tyrosine-type recombinase/integrase [Terriglobales bacterium]